MFCRNCGNQLPDEAKFCNKCGTQVKRTPAPPVEAEAKQETTIPVTVVTPQPVPVVEQIPPAQEIIEPTPVPAEPEPVPIIPEPIPEPEPISEPDLPAVAPVIPESVPVAELPVAKATQASPAVEAPAVPDPVPVAVAEERPIEPAVAVTEPTTADPEQIAPDHRCPNCQTEITPGIKFCSECGSAIVNQSSTTENATKSTAESVPQSTTDTPQVVFPAKKKTSWKVWLGIIIALVVLVGGISKCASNSKGTDDDYISCAIQLTRNNLKSPSSAIFYNCVVEEIDNFGRILVSLEFESQNGFGAMVRSYAIVVLQDYDDGTFTYNTSFAVQFYSNAYEKDTAIELTKSLNQWNEPKAED